MIKILIVEDEPIAADFLARMLSDYFEDCTVEAIARSATEALQAYNALKPDLLIMDINLGDHFSFDLFEHIDANELNVIFTSGYEEFALRAIKVHAIDYLMKPINHEDIQSAIRKARERIRFKALNAPHNENKTEEVILVWENDKLKQVEIEDIIKIRSDKNYSNIFMVNGRQILTSRNLGQYEELLKEKGFLRIHKSCLINARHLESYKRGVNARVRLSDGQFEVISRRKRDEMMVLLNKYKLHDK